MNDDQIMESGTSNAHGDRVRFSGVGLVAGVTIGAVLAVGAAAYAASMTISQGGIGTSASAQTACANPSLSINSARTRYVAAGDRYEIASIDVDNVPVACRSPRVNRITVANVAGTKDPVSNGNAAPNDGALLGDFTAASNTETWASGQGPLLDNISSENPDVTFTVVIRG